MTNLERVINVVVDNLDLNWPNQPITTEHKLIDDLGADSLSFVEIILFIEDEFDIIIPDEESENFETIGDIVDFLDIYIFSR